MEDETMDRQNERQTDRQKEDRQTQTERQTVAVVAETAGIDTDR